MFHEPSFDRIICNICAMYLEIFFVANSMIRKSRNPNVSNPFELPFGSKRISTFNALNSQLETGAGRDEQMKMIGHQHKSVKQITFWSVSIKRFKKQFDPSLMAEKRPALHSVRGYEVSLPIVGSNLPLRYHAFPRGLKPGFILAIEWRG
jgi:hypothetical protein